MRLDEISGLRAKVLIDHAGLDHWERMMKPRQWSEFFTALDHVTHPTSDETDP